MARGRFISASLGGSRKFARLASDTHRMIYMLLIPSADAYGRVDVDPVTLSGRVLTRLSISPDVVSAALADMHSVGLIHLYDVGEDHYAEITNFHEHNDIDLSREAQGEIPDARGVLPPEKPPRGTKRADADPRVWSGDYLAANVHPEAESSGATQAGNAPLPPPSRPAPDYGRQAPHAADQRQSNPSAIRHEVEVEGEVEGEVKNPPTPLEEPQPPGLELVEAAPRRELSKPNTAIKNGKPRDRNAIRPIDQPFVDAWNENRGPLASVLSLDQGRRQHLDKLRAELGEEALEVFTDATKQVAREGFYRQRGYGLTQLLAAGSLLTWAEKWRSSGGMTDADRRLADKAKAVADAIGGL